MKSIFTLYLFLGFVAISTAQVINFPDANFKIKLVQAASNNWTAKNLSGNYFKIDSNSNGEIEVSEALQVSFLNVSGNSSGCGTGCIYDLEGIQFFSNLNDLNCAFNQISSLDVSSLSNLLIFRCDSNILTSLNINGLTNLKSLSYGNSLNPSFNNYLPNLDLSHLVNLEELYCGESSLTSLDISALVNLKILVCYYNQLTELDINGLNNLRTIFCEGNLMEELYLNNFANQISLHFGNNNNLKRVFLKAGKTFTYNEMHNIEFLGTPNLEYICVDDSNLTSFQTKLAGYNYTNCNLNTYCSFAPGGNYSIATGNVIFDNESNGCDLNDSQLTNDFKVNVANGVNSASFFSNESGNYAIPLQNGTHTITPVLENPDYFTITPVNYTVSFPTQSSPFIYNFCITPNGSHSDLEVNIFPLSPARPGFDANYKIVYKNKGNVPQSGAISLSFEDAYMDLVSANPMTNSQSFGLLIWDYNNLQPFESREILITFNINSPMETPAVNIGDQLDFATIINPISGDEFMPDNNRSLKQIVVGSLDPNDKTCVEGNVVGPDMIGEYVHYIIRFENTGTFAAENIVVKDMIDLTKFDISTLVPINSSHSYVTRIDGNKVEFIFENIQLPFDDANNDGYIAFKIKTKSTLAIGDTFTNNASIYFDYNFPIVTNTASTTIQELGNEDFVFSNYFTLYPNPAGNILKIDQTVGILIESVSIYNALGQLCQIVVGPLDEIEVSQLKTGHYILKIATDKGVSSGKFIKK